MEKIPIKIMRRSVHAFFNNYHHHASIAALFVLPFSISALLSQSAAPSSSPILRFISARLTSLFRAAGLPPSSQFFAFLNLKLSQSLLSSFAALPFSLTFLLFAKASILRKNRVSPFSAIALYRPLLMTHLINSAVVLSSNAVVLSLLSLVFNASDAIGLNSGNAVLALSAAGAVLYSLVVSNAVVVCNLATAASAVKKCGGYAPFLGACMLVRGRAATAVTVFLPVNFGMAAIEALFQYRVVKPYRRSQKLDPSVIGEALSIMYMYSLLVVLDVVVSCELFKSFKSGEGRIWENESGHRTGLEPEEKGALQA